MNQHCIATIANNLKRFIEYHCDFKVVFLIVEFFILVISTNVFRILLNFIISISFNSYLSILKNRFVFDCSNITTCVIFDRKSIEVNDRRL